MAKFKDLLNLPALHTFVEESGFNKPTDVQSAAIPRLLEGKSVSVLAQTGSGKTLAYALPIVELLKKLESDALVENTLERTPSAWIICPTEELGAQVEKILKSIAHLAKLRIRLVKKGSTQKQTRSSMAGKIDVLIGSPNRILGALKAGELKSDMARYLIFDEADQLFDASFLPDCQALVSRLQSPELQVGLFSATMPGSFADIRRETFPGVKFQEIELQGAHSLRDNISTTNYTVPYAEKVLHAAALLETVRGPGFLFVNLKKTAEEVYDQLTKALPKKTIHLLHGGMEKKDRRKAIARFEDGGDILVCTDIASRGIDIPGLNWVLNYDLPFEPVYYIHRCGRAGRNGAPAEVVNLVTTKDFPLITRINSAIENQSSLKLARVVGKRDASRKKAASKGKQTATRKKAARPKAAATPGRAKAKPGKPGRSKSEASRAARAQSKSEKPSRGKPAEGRSGRSQSASAKPARGKTATGKPARSSSPAGKPSRGKPPTGKPSRSRGAAGKPTSRKPTTKSRRKSR